MDADKALQLFVRGEVMPPCTFAVEALQPHVGVEMSYGGALRDDMVL